MDRKKKIIILLSVLFFLILGTVFLFKKPAATPLSGQAGHNNKNTQEEKRQQMANKFLNSSDPDLRAIATASQKSAPEPTSIRKIEEKFQTGKIDVNKYLKLKILAVFAPDKLPPEFQSQTFVRLEGDRVLAEIIDYNSQLNEQTKNLLARFLLLPDDNKSFFNPQANKKEIIGKLAAGLD